MNKKNKTCQKCFGWGNSCLGRKDILCFVYNRIVGNIYNILRNGWPKIPKWCGEYYKTKK